MFSGNKTQISETIAEIAFSCLKDSFASHNVNWEHESCQRALSDFKNLSLLVSSRVLLNMQDVGASVPYTYGKPTKQDILESVALVKEYYNNHTPNSKYGDKKSDAFRKIFVERIGKLLNSWEKQFKKFFKQKESEQ